MKRPLVAGIIAACWPGLGHVYLREWRRALVWQLMVAGMILIVVPASVLTAEITPTVAGIQDLANQLTTEVSTFGMLTAAAVYGFNVADAMVHARMAIREQAARGKNQCPECGKDLDPDLQFCHWCTARLDAGESLDAGETKES